MSRRAANRRALSAALRRRTFEMYQRTALSDFSARTVDARGNIITGTDLVSGLPIGAGGIARFPKPDIVGITISGQSNAQGEKCQPAQTTVAPYATVYTFSPNGPRNQSTAKMAAVETDLSDIGELTQGETIATLMGKHFVDISLSAYGQAIATNETFVSVCGKNGVGVASLDVDSTQHFIMRDHVKKAFDIAAALPKTYQLRGFPWLHGETDTQDLMDYATYKSLFQVGVVEAFDTYARIVTGQRYPMFCLVYQNPYRVTLNDGPTRALYDSCIDHPLCKYVMNTQAVPRFSDGLHFTADAQAIMAYYFGRALAQIVYGGRLQPDHLKPTAARWTGTYIEVDFACPVAPLVIDTTNIGAATQNGVKLVDSVGNVALSAFSVVNSTTLRCTPANAPVGAWSLRIGLDWLGAGLNIESAASTNLRDSTATTVTVNGSARNTWHWAPACSLAGSNV